MSRDYYIGEVALIVGWLYALEKFITSRKSVLLLFEDDLWFNNDGNAGINQLMRIVRNTPTNTDLLSLYSPEGEFHRYNSTLNINNFVCKHFSSWSMAFTLITQKGASKILAAFRNGVNCALDGFLFGLEELQKFGLRPEQQTPFFSIYDRRWIGSTIDPELQNVPQIKMTEEDLNL